MLRSEHGEFQLAEVADSDLVERSQTGDLDAYTELVRRHSPMAYRVALGITGRHHDAEDVAQESLITAWQQLSTFRGSAQFSTWLFQIVTRCAINRAQRRRDHPTGSDLLDRVSDPTATTEDRHERDATQDALTQAVRALPPPQRAVVVLYYFEKLSYADVAAATGYTVPAVRSHLLRARRNLGTALTQWK